MRKRRKGALSADDHRFVMASSAAAKCFVQIKLYPPHIPIAKHFHSAAIILLDEYMVYRKLLQLNLDTAAFMWYDNS